MKYAKQATDYDDVDVPPDARRKLELLKLGITLPAPSRPGAAQELSEITTRLSSTYSTGKIEFDGRTVPQAETEVLMRQLRDPDKLEEVWTKWHDHAAVMKPDYARMVEIANEGARELGFADVGALWRAGYDMPPDEFTAEVAEWLSDTRPVDPDTAAKAVLAVLSRHVSPGQIAKVQGILPERIRDVWQGVRGREVAASTAQ